MDKKIKIIFFGTPSIAVKCLKSLYEERAFEILSVVTQEDKPVGRKKIITPPEVKVFADAHGLPVFQPKSLNDDALLYDKLARLKPDYNVVVAYGQIMSKKWLDMPLKRSINLHVSLLPKYRGASPMQSAILHGDSTTGVTIQEMAFKMDTGKILAQEPFKIASDDTFFEVYDRGGDIGARLLVNTLKADFEDKITPTSQDESQASYCAKITKEDGFVDFATMTAGGIYNQYRAYKMWPGIWTMYKGKRMKLTEIRPVAKDDFGSIDGLRQCPATAGAGSSTSGTFAGQNQLFAKCKEGLIEVLRCQIEGKKEMTVSEFLLGR